MSFKNAVKMLLSKFYLVWTVLAYLIVFGVILILASLPFLIPLISQIKSAGIGNLYHELYVSIVTAQSVDVIFENAKLVIQGMRDLFAVNSYSKFNVIMLFVFVLGFIYRFVVGLYELPLYKVIDAHMSSNAKLGFFNNFVGNLGKSARFVLAKMLYTVPFDVIISGIITLLLELYGLKYASIIIPFAIMLITFILYTLRFSIMSMWLPHVVAGNGIFESFVFSARRCFSNFGSVFSSFLVAFILIILINVPIALFTFGAGLLLSVPVSVFFLNVLGMVLYYGKNNKRYYLDAETIVTPPTVTYDEEEPTV